MGRVCLQNALLFGIAAAIVTWIIYPFIKQHLDKIPHGVMNIISAAIISFYAILECLYIINPPF